MANLVTSKILQDYLALDKSNDFRSTPVGLINMTTDKVYQSTGLQLDKLKHGDKFEVWHPFRDITKLGKTYGDYVVTQNGLPLIASTVIDKDRVKGGKFYNKVDYSSRGMQVYDLSSDKPLQVPLQKLNLMLNPARFDFETNKIIADKGSWINIFTDNDWMNWIKRELGEKLGDTFIDGMDMAHLVNKAVGGTWTNNLFNLIASPAKVNRAGGGDAVAEHIVSGFMSKPENKDKVVVYTAIPFYTNKNKSADKILKLYGLKNTDQQMAAADSSLKVIQAIDPKSNQIYSKVGVVSGGQHEARIIKGKELDDTIARTGIKFGE